MSDRGEPAGADVPRVTGLRLWVVGDVMLDVYVEGSIERISPEAPVPVVAVADRDASLGGAANVAANAAGLGATVTLFGTVGDDGAAGTVRGLLGAIGVEDRLVVDPARRTTTKTRVITAGRHAMRLDEEDTFPIAAAVEAAIARALRESPPPDAIVVSDYAKGVVTTGLLESVKGLRPAPIIVVDPKSSDPAAYRGVGWITPNEAEARRLLGDDRAVVGEPELRRLASETGAGVVLTRGPRGITLVDGAGRISQHPVATRAAADVTGAGDTVVAAFATFLAAGVDPGRAADLANRAAGIAVSRPGTQVVSHEDVLHAEEEATRNGKLVSERRAAQLASAVRRRGGTVVFTNGCFDLLHAGHLHLLSSARAEGDLLVVGLDDDEEVRRLKGAGRPVITAVDRARLLAALDVVDVVVVFNGQEALERLIGAVAPGVLVKGAEYEPSAIAGAAGVLGSGGRVVTVPHLPGRSTTAILSRAIDGPGVDAELSSSGGMPH